MAALPLQKPARVYELGLARTLKSDQYLCPLAAHYQHQAYSFSVLRILLGYYCSSVILPFLVSNV